MACLGMMVLTDCMVGWLQALRIWSSKLRSSLEVVAKGTLNPVSKGVYVPSSRKSSCVGTLETCLWSLLNCLLQPH
jgi:hypothetical protein